MRSLEMIEEGINSESYCLMCFNPFGLLLQ